jgi:aspartate dehydrogenase
VIGCGNIGTILARAVKDGRLGVEIGAIYDIRSANSEKLARILGSPEVCKRDFGEFVSADLDLVVEAASISAVRDYGKAVLSKGRDLLVLSVGALLDDELRESMLVVARKTGCRIIVPSGAIGGLDLLKSASVGDIQEVVLTTTKNPASLDEVGDLGKRKVVFEGNADEAIEQFPKNINVAAAISLASGAKLRVRIVADPRVSTNTHEIKAKGAFGEMVLRVSNVPSPDNPKTSYLAALSVIRTIQGLGEALVIGT